MVSRQSIDCSQCSDCSWESREITVFNKSVKVKNYICSEDGIHYQLKPDKVKLQMSICPTGQCNADCPFCVAGPDKVKGFLDINRLEKTLRGLNEQDIIRGISLTGGEPTLDMGLLNETVNLIFDVFGENMEICINTNGSGIADFDKIEKLHMIESVHLSRHHYDEDINRKLFGGSEAVPSNALLKEVITNTPYKDLFVLNCLLMKDYIGNAEGFHRFMDFAIEEGARNASFITLMPVNSFAKAQFIKYDDVIRPDDERIVFTKKYFDRDYCRCQDGIYVSQNGDICEFYGRETLFGTGDYIRGFVYGADNHLRTGFRGEPIV